jgi:hypothetical protein
VSDDDEPVTREQLKIQLKTLRTELEIERLERKLRNMWLFAYALTFIYFIFLAMMMRAIILTRTG